MEAAVEIKWVNIPGGIACKVGDVSYVVTRDGGEWEVIRQMRFLGDKEVRLGLVADEEIARQVVVFDLQRTQAAA